MTDRMILGEEALFSTDPNLTGINNNAIIVSSLGSGKTMSYIEPRLLDTEKSSLVVTLTKRRFVQRKLRMSASGQHLYYITSKVCTLNVKKYDRAEETFLIAF